MDLITNKSYLIISNYYKNKETKRSKVPLINHINEGILILKKLSARQKTIEAYCLHPILQSDKEFNKNKNSNLLKEIDSEVIILTMEYRRVANSYLSKSNIKDFVGISCKEVKNMLIADKIQNYKDFLLYHKDTHEKSKILDNYFNNWFSILNINYKDYEQKLKLEIIEETVQYYTENTSRRVIDIHTCKYFDEKTGSMCAVGRCLINPEKYK